MNAINSKPIEEIMLGMSIGSKLRHWRKVKGMTQKELAQKLNTRQPSISRIEDDNYLPSLSFLIRIARVLEKRIDVRFT